MMKLYFYILTSLLLFSCEKKIAFSPETTVLIKQYKGFDKNETDSISSILESVYGVRTIIASNQELYSKAYINVKSARYRADSIIKFQEMELNDSIDYILGLTSKDISTTKRDKKGKTLQPEYKYQDWGIMGVAYCPGNSCVVSSYRLKNKDLSVYIDRLKKVSVHEFGHNLGLPHCPNKKCVMTDAVESVSTIDNAELKLCTDCAKKINLN